VIPHLPDPSNADRPAPVWLTTMNDMNMLLMIFFILMFSLLSQDKAKVTRLKESLEAIGGTADRGDAQARGRARAGEDDAAGFRTFESKGVPASEVLRPRGRFALVQRLAEGTLLTVGGAEEGFAEGSWTLSAAQRDVLVVAKAWLAGRRNVIEIRGHTSANLQDSVVLEADGRVRAFSTADERRDDRVEAANHSLLSWLRANEARRFLLTEHPELGDLVRFPEAQVRIRAEGWSALRADSSSPAERGRNRRVEILATSELLER
jgi:flagellar motor protein MotB